MQNSGKVKQDECVFFTTGVSHLPGWMPTACLMSGLVVTLLAGMAGKVAAQTLVPVLVPVPVTAAAPAREWRTPPTGDALRGGVLYQQQCTACHAVDSSKTGPPHRGVLGRRIGSLPGYQYSDELARSRLRWTPQTLNAWLEDPEELVAGQRMGFQVDSIQDRADLIAFLATLK